LLICAAAVICPGKGEAATAAETVTTLDILLTPHHEMDPNLIARQMTDMYDYRPTSKIGVGRHA
jgi:hypothetical protein